MIKLLRKTWVGAGLGVLVALGAAGLGTGAEPPAWWLLADAPLSADPARVLAHHGRVSGAFAAIDIEDAPELRAMVEQLKDEP